MKVLFLGNRERIETYLPRDMAIVSRSEIAVLPMDAAPEQVIEAGHDANVVVVDAIAKLTRAQIEQMPDLILIHSEGVAYNGIDIACARERHIPVCNERGANARAVGEHTVMLMLALLRSLPSGSQAVLSGRQIEMKEYLMVHGIHELSEMQVGLYGFGAIARETARLLIPFGPKVHYYCRRAADKADEEQYHASYLPEEDLLAQSDIISLHVPVTPETSGLCGKRFFARMKDGSYFINTARGQIVDNEALCEALISGKLQGAGLDTIAPEPVQKDNPLLNLPPQVQSRVILTPHIAGVTSGFFKRAHRTIWENIERAEKGEALVNRIV